MASLQQRKSTLQHEADWSLLHQCTWLAGAAAPSSGSSPGILAHAPRFAADRATDLSDKIMSRNTR